MRACPGTCTTVCGCLQLNISLARKCILCRFPKQIRHLCVGTGRFFYAEIVHNSTVSFSISCNCFRRVLFPQPPASIVTHPKLPASIVIHPQPPASIVRHPQPPASAWRPYSGTLFLVNPRMYIVHHVQIVNAYVSGHISTPGRLSGPSPLVNIFRITATFTESILQSTTTTVVNIFRIYSDIFRK